MVAVELVGGVVEPRRDRVDRARRRRTSTTRTASAGCSRRSAFPRRRRGPAWPPRRPRRRPGTRSADSAGRRVKRVGGMRGSGSFVSRAARRAPDRTRARRTRPLPSSMSACASTPCSRLSRATNSMNGNSPTGIGIVREAFVEFLVADRVAEDVVVDAVAEVGQLAAERADAATAARRRSRARSRNRGRVADLEREVAGMRAEEVQLLERRIPRRAREADRERQLVVGRRRPEEKADRCRAVGEVAVGQAALGC